MKTPKHPLHSASAVWRICKPAFSLIEIVVAVALLGIIAAIAIPRLSNTRTAVANQKLSADVAKLNMIVSAYLADRGTLDAYADPQEVLNQLKTTRTAESARVYVGNMTGRAVDVRLVARPQTTAQINSNAPRAMWNQYTSKFEISTEPGDEGISDFYLDDSLASLDFGTDDPERKMSVVKYNSANGWVWENADGAGPTRLTPNDATLVTTVTPSLFTPEGTGGPVVDPPVFGYLPIPVISPAGGTFLKADFPSSITISPNGAPGGGNSVLKYQITNANGTVGAWTTYTTALVLTPDQTLTAKNVSTNAVSWGDSDPNSQSYEPIISVLPAPILSVPGGSFTGVTFPASITISSNGAPGGSSSQLRYTIQHTSGAVSAWINYTGAITLVYGDVIVARNFSLDTNFYTSSDPVSGNYQITVIKLPPPIISSAIVGGKKLVTLTMDTSSIAIPLGSYIAYTTNGDDPGVDTKDDGPVKGSTYKNPIDITKKKEFVLIARLYPPKLLMAAYDPSDPSDEDFDLNVGGPVVISPGLAGGHFDVDTSHMTYGLNAGKTDGHVHAYDDKFNVVSVNMMAFHTTTLRNIQDVIPAGQRFRLIVSNANLSTGGKLSINQSFNQADPSTFTPVATYDNTSPASLPVYSIGGVAGSTKLTSLSMNFDVNVIVNSGKGSPTATSTSIGGIFGTVTGSVRKNAVGALGEHRNGALVLQAVAVNSDGTSAFTTSLGQSNGGVQGAALTGLLWECAIFWHWRNGSYDTPR